MSKQKNVKSSLSTADIFPLCQAAQKVKLQRGDEYYWLSVPAKLFVQRKKAHNSKFELSAIEEPKED